jgi:hypothetical protein
MMVIIFGPTRKPSGCPRSSTARTYRWRSRSSNDSDQLAERVLELTEEESDVDAVELDEDDETTSGRLVRAAKLLGVTLERAHREGAGLLFGSSGR